MMFALHTSPVTGHHSFWIKICLESITGICFQANLEEYGKGCLPKKKVHMEGHCPNFLQFLFMASLSQSSKSVR